MLATATAKRIGAGDGLDRWYPYYAGYTHQFAADVIAEMCGKRSCTVLDPWNGSGTTTAAASHGGHRPVGFDLNPATLVIANAKLVHRAGVDRLPSVLAKCLGDARRRVTRAAAASEDPLRLWLPPRAAGFARHAFEWLATQSPNGNLARTNPELAIVAICLLRTLRQFAIDVRSNSSWTLPQEGHRVRIDSIEALATAVASEFRESRQLLPEKHSSASARLARLGDARDLRLRDNSVDFVLTSPPYCTRIDYAKQMRFELAALFRQGDQHTRLLRHMLMGTTTLRTPPQRFVKLPSSVSSLLHAIKQHPSHRSAGYYHKNVSQYFEDAFLAVGELQRVMRPGGRAVLVLQNSYYKEIPIPLSDLFCDIGAAHGLVTSVVLRRAVGRSMTSLNTRSKRYNVTRAYSEDLVLMEKKS